MWEQLIPMIGGVVLACGGGLSIDSWSNDRGDPWNGDTVGEEGTAAPESSETADSGPSSTGSLATFRETIGAQGEAGIYERIRRLEGMLYEGLPPQNNPREYEMLVREHFNSAITVQHFREIWDVENVELLVLEGKGLLQDRLVNLMLGEEARVLELSPYPNIRKEVYSFIEDKVAPHNYLEEDAFRLHRMMETSLTSFIEQVDLSGRNSRVYREFYSHFTDEEVRRGLGLPLP